MRQGGWYSEQVRAPERFGAGPHFAPARQQEPEPAPRPSVSWRQEIAEWLRALYLTRFSLLVMLALILIGPLGTRWLPSMLSGLFLLNSPLQMLLVTIVSLLVASMARVSWGVTLLNAPRRFHDCVHISRHCLKWSPWDWIPTAGIGLLPPLYCLFATQADAIASGAESFPAFAYWTEIATGLVAVALALLVATALQERLSGSEFEAPGLLPFEWMPWMEHLRDHAPPPFVLRVEEPLARLLDKFGPGYTRTITDPRSQRSAVRLAPGHLQSIICLLFTFVAYALVGVFSRNLEVDAPWFPPAICYALLTLQVLGWAITAAAFFLDRYRVPVFFSLLGISWFSYWGFGLDHYYAVAFDNEKSPTPPRLSDIIHPGWKIPKDNDRKRTLVVVTASGGGIQASAWTTKVLCGLHDRYPRHFAQSLGLISGVSGGSVGTMFYLVHLQTGRDPLDDDASLAIQTASRQSSLDAASWGFAYPDFVRNVAPPLTELLFHKYTDRGSAIESTWDRFVTPSSTAVVGSTETYLHDLVEPMKRHQLPVVVFNSVVVETGQRLLISPVCQDFDRPQNSAQPQEFLSLYPGAHLSLATGARLSATFPFVSPICRPTPSPHLDEARAYHVADGAYADNEGIVTAVDWINELCEFYAAPENEHTRPFDRVLFVRIQPFPTRQVSPAVQGKGWTFATTGPLQGMLNVRQASQAERGNLEADLLAATRHLQSETRNLRMQAEQAQQLAKTYAPQADLEQLDAAIGERQSRVRAPVMNKMPMRSLGEKRTPELTRGKSGRPGPLPPDGIEVDAVTVTFPLAEPEAVLPMSWKLSEVDKHRIDRAWQKLLDTAAEEANPLVKLDEYFPADPTRTARAK